MSLNLADLDAALYTRLSTDVTLIALVQDVGGNPAIYGGAGDPNTKRGDGVLPWVVFEYAEYEQDDTFTENIATATYEVVVYDAHENGNAPARAVLDQIFALLHRWTPTLAGANTASTVRRLRGRTAHDLDVWSYVETYEVLVTEG